MKRSERMKVLRKVATPTLEKRQNRIQRALEQSENHTNHLRAYVEDISLILNERENARVA